MNAELNAAVVRLSTHIERGTLIRNAWTGTDAEGRETACLLAAMVPQCGADGSAQACPAEVMPRWLAELVPSIDDSGSNAAWPAMVQRFAGLAARWHGLDAAGWLRVQFTFLAATVREAMSHAQGDPSVTAVCERVIALCNETVRTGEIDEKSFAAAGAAARAAEAAWAAARAAAGAAAARAAEAEAAAWDQMTVALFDAIEAECVRAEAGQ